MGKDTQSRIRAYDRGGRPAHTEKSSSESDRDRELFIKKAKEQAERSKAEHSKGD